MTDYSIAIIGEAWEATFARETACSLSRWMPREAELVIPAEFVAAMKGIVNSSVHILQPEVSGFQSYANVRNRVCHAIPDKILMISAGVLPATDRPIECLGTAYCEPRIVEWIGSGFGNTTLHFSPPVHSPLVQPKHRVRQIGTLNVWEVTGGDQYFQALMLLEESGAPPVWKNYGPGKPVFVYNTNDFDEPLISAHECYVVLASGLLGLRLVVESNPLPGAKVIVYDINPNQLAWTKHVLLHAGDINSLKELIKDFHAEHPGLEIRPLQPHEEANAQKQEDWYHRNHRGIASIARGLRWEFLECDLLAQPGPLLRKLNDQHSTCVMYLDLFVVWHIDGETPWVEHHVGMARSFEKLLVDRMGGHVSFVPGPDSKRFQVASASPFFGGAA